MTATTDAKKRMPRKHRSADRTPDTSGRISMVEAVAYTAFLALVAAVASGVFDPMLPWR